MKRLLAAGIFVGMTLAFGSGQASALDCKTSVLIPERYALTICPNVDPATKLNEKSIIDSAKKVKEEQKVEQVKIAFYAPGKKAGEGVLAVAACGGLAPDGAFVVAPDEEKGRILEKILGYEISPQKLWQAYDDNEVVADEDFKGKPILLTVKNSGLAKDALGKPYLKVPTDQFGLQGLQIYLSKDDPFLRKLKKGQKLAIQAFPKGFIMQSVVMDGQIVYIEEGKKKK